MRARRLLHRNVAILIAVVLASQLLTGALVYALVIRPQTDAIAEVTASMTGAISQAMAELPPAGRAALRDKINADHIIAIRTDAPPDGHRAPTLIERRFLRALARHLDLAGQTVMVWRCDDGGRLWVRLALGGEPAWVSVSPRRFRGPLTSMALALATSLLAALIGGVLLQRHLDRPLRRLAAALDSFDGTASPPLAEDGPEEIAAAARALNRMTARLAAQEAERALLLAGVSHDLRTPLTRLRLALAMMQGEDLALIDSATRQADRIEAMLGQFLTFARGFEAEPVVPVAIAALLADVAREASAVEIEAPGDLTARVRPAALARAIDNLLRNALRYGQPPVHLAAVMRDGALEITVHDRGGGFAPEQAEALCRPFARGDEARSGDGTGLGLAIAQRVAQAHGGRLEFRREVEGFAAVLVLPLA